jgi:hypothetical protein
MIRVSAMLAFLFLALPLFAQEDSHALPPLLPGVWGAAQFSWHGGAVTTSDALYDCCTFSDGNGIGVAAGFRLLLGLSPGLSLRMGIGYEESNGEYSTVRQSYPVLGADNTVEFADLDQALTVSIRTVLIEGKLHYTLVDPGLYLCGGPVLHIVSGSKLTHVETIASPADLRYIDGTRSRILVEGGIADLSSYLSLRVGIGSFIPLQKSVYVNPEVLYSFALTDIRPASAWSISGFQLSIGVYAGL